MACIHRGQVAGRTPHLLPSEVQAAGCRTCRRGCGSLGCRRTHSRPHPAQHKTHTIHHIIQTAGGHTHARTLHETHTYTPYTTPPALTHAARARCRCQLRDTGALTVRKATDLERVSTSATFWIAAIRAGIFAPEAPAMLAVRARAEPVADVAAARSQGSSRRARVLQVRGMV